MCPHEREAEGKATWPWTRDWRMRPQEKDAGGHRELEEARSRPPGPLERVQPCDNLTLDIRPPEK